MFCIKVRRNIHMEYVKDLETPAVIVDMDIMEKI